MPFFIRSNQIMVKVLSSKDIYQHLFWIDYYRNFRESFFFKLIQFHLDSLLGFSNNTFVAGLLKPNQVNLSYFVKLDSCKVLLFVRQKPDVVRIWCWEVKPTLTWLSCGLSLTKLSSYSSKMLTTVLIS